MALSRRSGSRFQSSIWPGFVDAMTGLLLVLMFVLTIFMVLQAVQTQQISGQEDELNSLSGEVAALAQALGMERQTSAELEAQVGALNVSLTSARDQAAEQAALIASLTSVSAAQAEQLENAKATITDFEAQVATLLSQREDAQARITSLEGEQADLLTAQEALNLALAQARSETDAQAEAARLAAARRDALDALVADLRARNADAQSQLTAAQLAAETARSQAEADRLANEATLSQVEADRLAKAAALTQAEADRLAEAAAAELLRARLQDADAELTAMTLALEAQRKDAEDTLTLLAAARAAQAELDAKLGASEAARLAALAQADKQMTDAEKQAALLAMAQSALAGEEKISAEAQRQTELLNQQVASLRGQLGELQSLLDDAVARDAATQVQLQSLGSDLNTALARVAAEERRRAELEAAERKRLEAETKNLEQYRSEFFGRLRDLLGNQPGVRIEGDRFVFSSEVLFPPGAATLSEDGRGEIAKVASILRNVATEIPPEIDWVIRVDGHTDNQPLSGQGQFEDNWELSQARALSVVKYMINFLGIAPDRLAANGFGQYQPVASGNSEEARAQNRRIELKFTEK
ncbi:peptidoglycan -binding protein [Sulfitobacter sp.]|jgi:chemotaxis protein MotB|uniref:peptidoglycan -binding protein n=1 Tax=unclassified Sulfitobacter TaxID=196795 RepID=UPI0025D9DCB1|nr:peptidoglycan -binding protein [uncultured Sulfitobacter sp.]